MKKVVIGIVSRFSHDEDNMEIHYISNVLRKSLISLNTLCFGLIPVSSNSDISKQDHADLEKIVDLCDGIIFPGGYEWSSFDETVYECALKKDMPILGICLGMQMMCKVDGAKIILNDTAINHKQLSQYVHENTIVDNTILKKILKTNNICVNSRHLYHADKVEKLKVSAYSEDGLIEAVEYPNKSFVLGVQWHPEDMLAYDENALKIMKVFTFECQKYQKKYSKK